MNYIECILSISSEAIETIFEERPRELVRCKDCRKNMMCELTIDKPRDWFCADGKKNEEVKL